MPTRSATSAAAATSCASVPGPPPPPPPPPSAPAPPSRSGARPPPPPTAVPVGGKPGFWSRLFGRRHVAEPTTPAPAPPQRRESRVSRDLDRGHGVARLPGTRTEGERIAKLLRVAPWLDAAVLEARLKA